MIPRHIAIIMDGNGRWAQKKLLPRSAGHRAGFKRMLALCDHAYELGVEYITLYALSAENLSRPKAELDELFALFRTYFSQNVEKLFLSGVRLKVIGDRTLLPEDITVLIGRGEERTAAGTKGTLTMAVGYGGRQEILRAVNRAVACGKPVTGEEFSNLLDTGGLPDPDLLIRTGKEKRLSNFLLWQSAYTELYFSDKMFPAFTNADLDKAIADYEKRDRRFGKVNKG